MSRSGKVSELSFVRSIIGRDIKWKLDYMLAILWALAYISRTCASLANHYSSAISYQCQNSSHDSVEPDQRSSIGLEGRWDRIQRNLNIDLTLAKLNGGPEGSSKRAFLDDPDLTEFEVSLFLEVELINVPCAASQLDDGTKGWVLTPSN
jgi:hypothetical protein